jgi:ABC-type transport system involved in multi-copper enzyme maturation permease subunit
MLDNEWKEVYQNIIFNIQFESLKNWKAKRTIVAFATACLLALLFFVIPVLTNTEFPIDSDEFLASNLGLVNYLIMLNAIIFGADAINREHQQKTTLLIYPLPQRRTSIVVGKFIVHLVTSWIIISLYYLITSTEFILIYGIEELTNDMIKSLLFALIYMASTLAIAFFLSAIANSPAISMALTFFLFFLLLPTLNSVLILVDIDSTWLVANYSGIITKVFRFPSEMFLPRHMISSVEVDFDRGIEVCLAYTLVFFTGGWFTTLRKEV